MIEATDDLISRSTSVASDSATTQQNREAGSGGYVDFVTRLQGGTRGSGTGVQVAGLREQYYRD